MKPLRHIYKLAFALPALLLAGCSDDNEPIAATSSLDGETPSELTLTLSVPDEQVVNLGSRADAEVPAISTVTVYCFSQTGTGGGYLSHKTFDYSEVVTNAATHEITVPIHKNTKSVHLITNAAIGADVTDPVNAVTTDVNAGVMWGRADLKDIITKGSTFTLMPNTARVSIKNEADGFTASGFTVSGTADRGTVAPSGWNTDPSDPTIGSGTTYPANSTLTSTDASLYVFETPEDDQVEGQPEHYHVRGRIVIEGTYGGVKGYYTVAFRQRTGNVNGFPETPGNFHYIPLHVIRNHHYIVNIKEVRAQGWPTIEEALKAEPDNRLTVEITDKTPEITDIIASRDYMLGVGDDVTVTWDAEVAQINVATSWSGKHASTGKPYEVTVSADAAAWVDVSGINEASFEVNFYERDEEPVTTYVLNVPLSPNNQSTQPRTATLTVRSGDLTRTLDITQAGRDYMRDPNRPVKMVMNRGYDKTINDWFAFVDNECKGLLPENSHTGAGRNDGLIFPAVPAYTVTYRIPQLSGDQGATCTGNFSCDKTTDSDYYIVTANITSKPNIEIGSLTITNADGVKIVYPLYQTGYMHELTADTETYQREGGEITGWFYYEVVKVGSIYMLDRNLGASSNKPYISTYAGFKDNTDAIGAYFKIATTKSTSTANPNTILGELNVSDFIIPTDTQISAWGIYIGNVSGTTGEAARVGIINTADGEYSQIYIPHGGYYEATSHKYETHGNIWTSTLVAGEQGFDPTLSPEFGYWFRYLNVYSNRVNFVQIRFANGSGGMAPTAESVFKYMPIRLMWKP